MPYLKALVTGLGILIIVAVCLLAYGLAVKTSSKPVTDDIGAESRIVGFDEIALAGNADCRIETAIPDGPRLVLHLTGTGEAAALYCEKAVIIDMSKGTIIGTVTLKP